MTLDEYIERISDSEKIGSKETVDYLAYYLIKYEGKTLVTKASLDQVYKDLRIKPYSRIAQYLSEESKKKGGKYIYGTGGYVLERSLASRIGDSIEKSPRRVQIDQQLKGLVAKIVDTQEKDFLEETIICLSVQANRAAIVMMWILTMDHLQKHIFNDSGRLLDFNEALSKRGSKKLKPVKDYDDFSEIKESEVIEIARSASVISSDVRKILDEKLGIRNSAGHPSSVIVHESKVNEFIFDLTNNVLLKY